MRHPLLIATFLLLLSSAYAFAQSPLEKALMPDLASLVSTYKMLHASPELSHHEEKTSAFFAKELRTAGFDVTERVGRYENSTFTSYGVVAVMKNGSGPTVLVRTELDALPVEERTGLPYASKVRTQNDIGQDTAVMHACGHDLHMTSLLGTARMLAKLKDRWKGTLIIVGQPAEETIDGARAMMATDIYSKFGKPDYLLALHDSADLPAGVVGYCPGYALASSTSVDITIRGLGGHGSKPEATKDPIVLAAQTILALQTIVSRENSPLDPAVVTIGSIHGGTKRNIIPDEVTLLLTIRTYKDEVRTNILKSIERIVKGTALAAGIPNERAPIVKVSESEYAPSTYNDPALTERMANVFRAAIGNSNVIQVPPVMGSEDFGNFGFADHRIPSLIFWLGAVEPSRVEESRRTGKPLPSLHSSLFQPLPEPAIKTGVTAMTSAVLDLMK